MNISGGPLDKIVSYKSLSIIRTHFYENHTGYDKIFYFENTTATNYG